MAGTVLVKFAVLGVLAIAAARLSTTAAAAHTIAAALVSLAFTAAVAIGQAVVPLVTARTDRQAAHGSVVVPPVSGRTDRQATRGVVVAGLAVAVTVLAVLCAVLVVADVVPLFSADQAVVAVVRDLLPFVVLVVLADGVQAVLGFGLAGLKRTTSSLVVFALCYGVLALVALPITGHGGLTGLWTALAGANLLVAVGQAFAFQRATQLLRTGP